MNWSSYNKFYEDWITINSISCTLFWWNFCSSTIFKTIPLYNKLHNNIQRLYYLILSQSWFIQINNTTFFQHSSKEVSKQRRRSFCSDCASYKLYITFNLRHLMDISNLFKTEGTPWIHLFIHCPFARPVSNTNNNISVIEGTLRVFIISKSEIRSESQPRQRMYSHLNII